MSDIKLIHTQGLDEGIRCAMCTNVLANHKGCDGLCKVDKEMYKKVMSVIDKAFDKKPTVEMAEDCISREQAVYVASGYCEPQNIADELRKLPSVTPQPKRGKWIGVDETHSICEKCEAIFEITSPNAEVNFCPSCGVLLESEMQI